jgi:DNA-binding beta-propeller fold protein YncE
LTSRFSQALPVLLAAASSTLACRDAFDPAASPPFEVVATLEIGTEPHGIRFSDDGDTAYIALSREGRIAVVDLDRLEVVDYWETGGTPFDLLRTGRGWLVSHFGDSTLAPLDPDGSPSGTPLVVGRAPTLFSEPAWGLSYITSLFADRVTAVDPETGVTLMSFPTGAGPYPASALSDGSLAFLPNSRDGTVLVIDLLSEEPVATVEVCPAQGGALTRDGVHYLVACSLANEVVYLNTASFKITARVSEGIGPRPFTVAITRDGRYGIVNNADSTTVSILEIASRRVVQELEVGGKPTVVRMHPDGRRVLVSNDFTGTLTVLRGPPPPSPRAGGDRNEVVVLGMIHGEHRTSDRYGIETLKELVREIDPDFWLIEVPPNRLERAIAEFEATGEIEEPRVIRFPEYVDVLFPLTRELDFEIVPTAGWNPYMADYRSHRLQEIADDPVWAVHWEAYQRASASSDSAVRAGGPPDDPRWIHTDAYDAALEIRYSVYNRLFNDELGPGGWDHINRAHFDRIAATLDEHRGEGVRFLITYGAGHKGWFLRELRKRDDIELLDVGSFLEAAGR